MKPALSTTARSVRAISWKLAALGTLLGTVAWTPAAFDGSGGADRAVSAKDNCIVQALLPGTVPSTTPAIPWFLQSNSRVKKSKSEAEQVLGRQGLKFTENRGQATDDYGNPRPEVRYYGSTRSAKLYLTSTAIGYVFLAEAVHTEFDKTGQRIASTQPEKRYVVEMELLGSNPTAQLDGAEQAQGVFNYLRGEQKDWIVGVPSFHQVTYREIYPNIDMRVSTQGNGMKYDFIVKPGGDPSQIRFRYSGAQKLGVLSDGKLRVTSPVGTIEEQRPYSYQGSQQQEVANAFSVNKGVVSFKLGSYDRSQTLVIDPIVIWSTFFGGDGDDNFDDVEIRPSDGAFVAVGWSNSTAITSAGTPINYFGIAGAPPLGSGGPSGATRDGLIAKFNSDNSLAWYTFIGGTREDLIHSVELDGTAIYVMGTTQSRTGAIGAGGNLFPALGTVGCSGTGIATTKVDGTQDAFVACFTNAGLLTWDFFKGGAAEDEGLRLSVKTIAGVRFLAGTGSTTSGNLVTTNQSGPGCTAVTCAGGTPNPLLTVNQGGAHDAFVFRWLETNGAGGTPNGALEQWSTYLGGEADDVGTSIEMDSQGSVLVGGYTESLAIGQTTTGKFPAQTNGQLGPGLFYPTHMAAATGSSYDGYQGKFLATGCLAYMGFLGAGGNDFVIDGGLDALDQYYLVGNTLSDGFSGTEFLPVAGVGQKFRGNSLATGDGGQDAFMTVLTSSTASPALTTQGNIRCTTYHGGSEADYATDSDVLDNSVAARSTTVILCGYTQSRANAPSNGLANGGLPTSPGDNQCLIGASALQSNITNDATNSNDWWMACFNPQCCRLWSSYWGGGDQDYAYGISSEVLPIAGRPGFTQDVIVVSGQTYSDGSPAPSFPTLSSGTFFQGAMAATNKPDAALLKFAFAADEKLPIELSSFGASVVGMSVNLDWRTASEDGNAGFELERAELATPYDVVNFKRINSYVNDSRLVGLGTSPIGKSYSYSDADGLKMNKIYLYRLIDISEDGLRTPHPGVSVRLEGSTVIEPVHGFRVEAPRPNPADEAVTLQFTLQEDDAVTIEIYSVDGKKISTPIDAKNYVANTYTELFSVKTLAPGVYTAVLTAHNSNNVRTRQFVVVR